MSKVYMMVGIQGSGKSTLSNLLSKTKDIKIVSSDRIRTEMPELPEENVFPEVYKRISGEIKENRSVIFDATSISLGARANLFTQLENNGLKRFEYEVVCVYFIPNLELSLERVRERNKDKNERFMPLDVIEKYAKDIVEPTLEEGFNRIIKIKSDENLCEVINKME